MSTVAEATFYARTPKGDDHAVTMVLSAPKPTPVNSDDQPPYAYAASVLLTPFHDQSRVFGETAFQALSLSLSYLRSILQRQIDAGWRFYLEPDRAEPFDPISFYLDTVKPLPSGFAA